MVFYPIFVNVNTKCLKKRNLEDLLLPTVLGRLKKYHAVLKNRNQMQMNTEESHSMTVYLHNVSAGALFNCSFARFGTLSESLPCYVRSDERTLYASTEVKTIFVR